MSSSIGRILCTEDDPDSREMLVLVLEAAGYEVVCPEDVNQALHFAKLEAFDLILLDNWMPILDGCNLAVKIREFNQHTPILFYSGAAAKSDVNAAIEAGAQGYLTKPTGIDELCGEIARLIEQSKR